MGRRGFFAKTVGALITALFVRPKRAVALVFHPDAFSMTIPGKLWTEKIFHPDAYVGFATPPWKYDPVLCEWRNERDKLFVRDSTLLQRRNRV